MMEAARTSETLVNFYRTTRRYSPEDSHLRIHRSRNLKSSSLSVRNILLGIISLIALMMEAVSTPETSVNFY
jgi:hypothetical protein